MAFARSLFSTWATHKQLQDCIDHIRLAWAESRHNPNFSRFDAVNNKYEQYIEAVNIRIL